VTRECEPVHLRGWLWDEDVEGGKPRRTYGDGQESSVVVLDVLGKGRGSRRTAGGSLRGPKLILTPPQ
ncbi:MAG: hypothetical protein ACM34G_12205, partial [Acidobacteriota bacterium]